MRLRNDRHPEGLDMGHSTRRSDRASAVAPSCRRSRCPRWRPTSGTRTARSVSSASSRASGGRTIDRAPALRGLRRAVRAHRERRAGGAVRIRQIRQEFWTDEVLAGLPDGARLFYVGLWMVADDEGWIRFDVPRIGAVLYPYRPKARRERDIRDWVSRLVELGRVRLLDCGCAVIPTLKRHQVIGGKRSRAGMMAASSRHGAGVPVPERRWAPAPLCLARLRRLP
jgi:hypothetical protein